MQADTLFRRLQEGVAAARADAEMAAALSGAPCGVRLAVRDEGSSRPIALHAHSSGIWLTLAAAADDWDRLMQPNCPVGWHSFSAARRAGVVAVDVEGESDELCIAQCLHALERVLEILRGQRVAGQAERLDLSRVTGRYADVSLRTGPCCLYLESSGRDEATPLVMLHTAGADARQFHAVMADRDLQGQWHMVAFDMPGHGRSEMTHDAWLGYRLDRDRYLDVVRAVLQSELGGRKAVLAGCSMGAAMALHAARELPHLVQGVIALEAPFRSPGRRTANLAHAQVNQAAHNPSYVRGLMGPSSPLAERRRAAWIYSQGGFGVYAGDLWFYSDDFDAQRDVTGLDGTRMPVQLLTGSFDHSATPADSKRVADLIPGSEFREMSELGHFPMTENPPVFLDYLKPALARVAARLQPSSDAGAGLECVSA